MCDTDEGSSGAPIVKTTSEKLRNVCNWIAQRLDKLNGDYGTFMSTIIQHIN